MPQVRYKFLIECSVTAPVGTPQWYDVSHNIRAALEARPTGKAPKKKLVLDMITINEVPKSIEERITALEAQLDRLNEDPDY